MSKLSKNLLGIIQSFTAVMAIPAGISLILDTSGNSLGLPDEILQSTPFDSYLIPGLALLIGNGIFHLIGAILSFRRDSRSGLLGIGLGIFLLFWIIIQVYYIGNVHFLQPLFFGIALAEIVLSVLVHRKMPAFLT